MSRIVRSPNTAPVNTHRLNLDRSYFPNGNEDKDHVERFPMIPANLPLVADRIYADPYGPQREVLVNRNRADFFFSDHERGLAIQLRRTLTGKNSKFP